MSARWRVSGFRQGNSMQDQIECSYEELGSLLSAAGAESGASEAHGLFAGMICAGGRQSVDSWLGYLLGDEHAGGQAVRDCVESLNQLQTEIFTQLNDESLGFELLLPDDEQSLLERTRELGRWTAGFLYGLALGGIREDTQLPESVGEVVKDFYEISNADFVRTRKGDEDETAYMEIVEYVRMSVLLLYAELQSMPVSARLQ